MALICISQRVTDVDYLFKCLFAILIASLVNGQKFTHFYCYYFLFFLLSYESFSYILGTSMDSGKSLDSGSDM